MEALFALVLSIGMTNGDFQDVVLGVYDNQQDCQQAAIDQQVNGECFPVERMIRDSEQPARF